jgi:hypothetical protein
MFEWLERARMQRDPGLESLLMSPLLRRHLHDPRFAAFARSIGLPAPVEAATDKASAAVTP